MTSSKTRRMALASLFTAFALMLSYIEAILPLAIPVPGIKLGLANLAVLLMLYTLGAPYAAAVSLLRILLAALLFGSPFSLLYSLAGGVLAYLGMLGARLLRSPIIVASIIGALLHSVGQILAACIVTSTPELAAYLPYMLLASLLTGALIGVAGRLLLRYIPAP